MTVYLDSSAAVKLIWHEAATDPLRAFLAKETKDGPPRSCFIAETELRRAALRKGAEQGRVTTVLDGLDLADAPRELFHSAGLLPGDTLRSLDALHIGAALRMDADWFATYDRRQADAARACGLRVVSPGADD